MRGAYADPDGDGLTYTASVGDDAEDLSTIELSINGAGGVISGTFTAKGEQRIHVTASDGLHDSAPRTFVISVNESPTIKGVGLRDVAVAAGADVSTDLSAQFEDPDDDALTFSAKGLNGSGLSFDGGVISGSCSGKDDLAVTVTASDGRGGSISESLNIDSRAAPKAMAAKSEPPAVGQFYGMAGPLAVTGEEGDRKSPATKRSILSPRTEWPRPNRYRRRNRRDHRFRRGQGHDRVPRIPGKSLLA